MSARMPENVEDAYPLSPLQQGMLFHSIASPGSGVYLEQISARIEGRDFSADVFRESWNVVLDRHEALRAACLWNELKEPIQVIYRKAEPGWRILDWRGDDANALRVRLQALRRADRSQDFDLNQAPLMRMTLVRVADDAWEWIWTRHHLIADGWSTNHVLRELEQVYASRMRGTPLDLPAAPRYRDYIAWLKRQDRDAQQRFWETYLRGIDQRTVLGVESGRQGAHRVGSHGQEEHELSEATFTALKSLCRNARVTPQIAVQAAWSLLLGVYSGQDDVVWGATYSGRPADLPGVSENVGLFINTVPMRATIDWRRTVGEFLEALRDNQLSVSPHQNTALTDIRSWSAFPPGEPLFGTVFVYENYPSTAGDKAESGTNGRLNLSAIEYSEQSDVPLALIAVPGATLRLILIYDSSVYGGRVVRRLVEQLGHLLESMARGADTTLGALSFLSPPALAKARLSGGECLRRGEFDGFIDEAILARAGAIPDADAVFDGQTRYRYRDIETRSAMRSRLLAGRGIRARSVVALCLPRGADAIVWMLAVLRSGAAYVVLDGDQPASRIREMLRLGGASLLVTTSATAARVGAVHCDTVLVEAATDDDQASGASVDAARRPDDPAYILFTSGSTGTPKGVVVTHRNLASSTLARRRYYGEDPASFLLLSALTFDSSVAGIYWTLAGGGKLVVTEPRAEQDMEALLRLTTDEGITHTLCLPSLYRAMLEHARETRDRPALSSLKCVINAGEPMPSGSYLELHRRLVPGARLFNEYGPTEATVWCTVYDATHHDPSLPVPIGAPIPGADCLVLNRHGIVLPPGAIGELVVAGDGVAQGYLDDPEATARGFRRHDSIDGGDTRVYHTGDLVKIDEDDNLVFLGRMDEQVKIRGHRIEPGDIEARLEALDGVRDAAVVTTGADPSNRALCAFVVPREAGGDVEVLREALANELPEYMVPARFVAQESLPRLSNGKLDRVTLRQSASSLYESKVRDGNRRGPADETQRTLCEVWQETLGLAQIGIDENFFHLGGDSISSIRVVSRALSAGLRLAPNDIFEAPTIEALSRRATRTGKASDTDSSTNSAPRDESASERFGEHAVDAFPLTPTQTVFLFAHLSKKDADPGHMQIQARLDGRLDPELLRLSIGEVVRRHEALRTTIHWRDRDPPEQVVYDLDEVFIDVRDLRGSDASAAIGQYLAEDRRRGIDIERYPAWRFCVLRLADDEHLACWTLHHALVDGWSASIALSDAVEIYQSRLAGGETRLGAAPRYRDYAAWLDDADPEPARHYWTNLLAPCVAPRLRVPELTGDGGRAAGRSVYELEIGGERLKALRERLNLEQITFAQLLQSAWGACLGLAGDGRECMFYTTVSGRTPPVADLDRMVGQFVNHLPVVCSASDPARFRDIVSQVLAQSKGLQEHGHTSPALLQRCYEQPVSTVVRSADGPVQVQSLVLVENFPWTAGRHVDHPNSIVLSSLQRRGRTRQVSTAHTPSHFPLTLVGIPQIDHVTLALHFDPALFDGARASRLAERLEALLVRWSEDPDVGLDGDLAAASREFFEVRVSPEKARQTSTGGRVATTPLEMSLATIWKDILRKPIDDVQTSFFDLGGTSLMAVRMAESIESLLGLSMPLAMLIENNTIETLARSLHRNPDAHWQTVVRIQPHGSNPPIFGIHAEGNVLFYRDLARCLGDDQPFYGLQSPELEDGVQRFASIQEMAASYYKEIRAVQPRGPYTICGMCFGGLVAFETARQIVAAGEEIAGLIVMDAGGPQLGRRDAPAVPAQERNRFAYSRTAPLYVKAIKHLRTGRFLELSKKYVLSSRFVYPWVDRLESRKRVETVGQRFWRVRRNQEYLTRQYRGDVFPGTVSFIYSEQFDTSEKTQYELDLWNAACGGRLRTYPVSGRHRSILEPPQVYEVAEIVKQVRAQP